MCVAGKLYKSRVCFIKHLWEHTIYWDMFAGDKNHMRVLSIQAALILYGTCQQPVHSIPVDNLLVTSPHGTDNTDVKASADDPACATKSLLPGSHKKASCGSAKHFEGVLSARDAAKLLPTTPVKKSVLPRIPSTPKKKNGSCVHTAQKRKAPPKLDLQIPSKKSAVDPGPVTPNTEDSSPMLMATPNPLFYTPVKQRIPLVVPKTPQKKKSPACRHIHNPHRRVSRFFIPTTDTSEPYFKETDPCVCKRKRSE